MLCYAILTIQSLHTAWLVAGDEDVGSWWPSWVNMFIVNNYVYVFCKYLCMLVFLSKYACPVDWRGCLFLGWCCPMLSAIYRSVAVNYMLMSSCHCLRVMSREPAHKDRDQIPKKVSLRVGNSAYAYRLSITDSDLQFGSKHLNKLSNIIIPPRQTRGQEQGQPSLFVWRGYGVCRGAGAFLPLRDAFALRARALLYYYYLYYCHYYYCYYYDHQSSLLLSLITCCLCPLGGGAGALLPGRRLVARALGPRVPGARAPAGEWGSVRGNCQRYCQTSHLIQL